MALHQLLIANCAIDEIEAEMKCEKSVEADYDWRLNTSLHVRDGSFALNGMPLPTGARITVVAPVRLSAKKQLTLPIPNATAMCLWTSRRAFREARRLRDEASIDSTIKKDITFSTASNAIDFLSALMESVILAVVAIEAFANESIPDDFVYEGKHHSDTNLEAKFEHSIERYVSLDEKLAEVLPQALGCTSPKGKTAWSDYVELRRLRDRLVHMKTDDRRAIWPELNSVWKSLVLCKAPERTAKAMIDQFVPHLSTRPAWHIEYRNESRTK